jgi:MoaD family protein
MKVTVKYYAKYREFTGKMQDEFEFDKITLQEIIEKIGEIYPKIGTEQINLIALNGRFVKDLKTEIKNGDTISLFPPVSGG